jgi:hypothetical protein
MREDRRLLVTSQPEELFEPVGECHRVEPRERLGLPEARDVGNQESMLLAESGNHAFPVRPTGLDPAMEQDQWRSLSGHEHACRAAVDLESQLLGGNALKESAPGGLHRPSRDFASAAVMCPWLSHSKVVPSRCAVRCALACDAKRRDGETASTETPNLSTARMGKGM